MLRDWLGLEPRLSREQALCLISITLEDLEESLVKTGGVDSVLNLDIDNFNEIQLIMGRVAKYLHAMRKVSYVWICGLEFFFNTSGVLLLRKGLHSYNELEPMEAYDD